MNLTHLQEDNIFKFKIMNYFLSISKINLLLEIAVIKDRQIYHNH